MRQRLERACRCLDTSPDSAGPGPGAGKYRPGMNAQRQRLQKLDEIGLLSGAQVQ
jgi:hypothetical protein